MVPDPCLKDGIRRLEYLATWECIAEAREAYICLSSVIEVFHLQGLWCAKTPEVNLTKKEKEEEMTF
jgi:hypothetical protein